MIHCNTEIKPFADALRQAGMTTREYAFWTMAFLEAAMVVSLKKTGMAKEIPKDANLANAKFVEDHMAENGGDTERVRATQEEGPLSWPAT